ncbi:MAG: hypothetical protein JNL12_19610 [Planctomycetes bacterium]|nr:hypothetical protein [Planctomycetota bacterium]
MNPLAAGRAGCAAAANPLAAGRVVRSVVRSVVLTIPAGALYGFSIGCSKNLLYAARSAVKVPMLLLGTALLCAIAYQLLARWCGLVLPMVVVQRLSLSLFQALAVLLASLSPVSLFLGLTMQRPTGVDLGGYPGFVGLNMLMLAVAGTVALVVQARRLLGLERAIRRRAQVVVALWLVLSLLVGGQLAFYLRPFFGIASLTGEPPFWLGDEPTATGARNFYEVVWQFLRGVSLPERAGR